MFTRYKQTPYTVTKTDGPQFALSTAYFTVTFEIIEVTNLIHQIFREFFFILLSHTELMSQSVIR